MVESLQFIAYPEKNIMEPYSIKLAALPTRHKQEAYRLDQVRTFVIVIIRFPFQKFNKQILGRVYGYSFRFPQAIVQTNAGLRNGLWNVKQKKLIESLYTQQIKNI